MSIVLEVKGISKAFKKKASYFESFVCSVTKYNHGFCWAKRSRKNYNHENDYEVFVS